MTERDRFIDAVRVAALAAVVFLHWLAVMPSVADGRFTDQIVVSAVPQLWPLTWLGDVMALFFFAGGYANWVSFKNSRERDESTGAYLSRRYRRLVLPTLGFLGAWLAVELLMRLSGLGPWSPLRHVSIGNTTPFGPLWFLGVYLVVVTLSPLTVAAHRRWGLAVPVVMTLGVVAADAAAVLFDSGAPLVVNLLLVWMVPHQLGYSYADGRLRRLSLTACAGLAVAGLLALVLLTSLPFYPRSLFDQRWKVLTMDAPTLPLVAEAVWFIGFALLLRPLVEGILADPRHWSLVSRANALAMPVYLWHMTAYLVVVVALGALGVRFAYATEPSVLWWLGRPVVMVLSGVVLTLTLVALERVQRLAHGGVAPFAPRGR